VLPVPVVPVDGGLGGKTWTFASGFV
jgi:hypothetical protein